MAKINSAALPDQNSVEKPSYDPPKDGIFTLQVVATGDEEIKPKSAGGPSDGRYAWFELEIMDDGESKGKTFRHMATYQHKKPNAQQAGLWNLNCICRATGFSGYGDVEDTDQTMFKPFQAEIVSKPQKNDKERFNTNVKKWPWELGAPGNKSQPQGGGQQQSQTQGGSGAEASTGDWRSKAQSG